MLLLYVYLIRDFICYCLDVNLCDIYIDQSMRARSNLLYMISCHSNIVSSAQAKPFLQCTVDQQKRAITINR